MANLKNRIAVEENWYIAMKDFGKACKEASKKLREATARIPEEHDPLPE